MCSDSAGPLLAALVEEGRADGSITTSAPADTVADLLLSLVQGMRVVGKGGLFPEQAEPLVALALRIPGLTRGAWT